MSTPPRSPALEKSPLLAPIGGSATIVMTQRARDLRAQGRSVIGLSHGQPDFETPANVREAAIAAVARGENKYTPMPGLPDLRAAIARKLARENALEYSPEETIVSTGGKQVLANALLSTVGPGDEVVLIAPYFVSYPNLARMAGGTVKTVEPRPENGLKATPEELDKAITAKTKWVILNSPGNPSGAVYSPDELKALAAVLIAHPHVWVLSDDIYEHLIYADFPFRALPAVEPRLKTRTLILNGLSKTYAMTGWRLGYGAGPVELIRLMTLLQSQITSGASVISQWAAVEALDGPQDFVAEARETFRTRRDAVVGWLRAVPGLDCAMPDGAFYAYPSIAGLIGRRTPGGHPIDSDTDFTDRLLEEAGVSAVPGAAFGLSPYFRVSYAASLDELREACRRIHGFCDSLL